MQLKKEEQKDNETTLEYKDYSKVVFYIKWLDNRLTGQPIVQSFKINVVVFKYG